MSRVPLFIFLFCLTNAAVDYNEQYNDIEFVPEHSNEWVVRIDEGKTKQEFQPKKNVFFVIGDDVADLVASELGLQNRRKVSNDDSIILK
jgi:hypothetical protein